MVRALGDGNWPRVWLWRWAGVGGVPGLRFWICSESSPDGTCCSSRSDRNEEIGDKSRVPGRATGRVILPPYGDAQTRAPTGGWVWGSPSPGHRDPHRALPRYDGPCFVKSEPPGSGQDSPPAPYSIPGPECFVNCAEPTRSILPSMSEEQQTLPRLSLCAWQGPSLDLREPIRSSQHRRKMGTVITSIHGWGN